MKLIVRFAWIYCLLSILNLVVEDILIDLSPLKADLIHPSIISLLLWIALIISHLPSASERTTLYIYI